MTSDYDNKVITYAINLQLDRHLDGLKSHGKSESYLKELKNGLDEIVWETAKSIYQDSGVQVSFSDIQKIALLRIEAVEKRNHLEQEKFRQERERLREEQEIKQKYQLEVDRIRQENERKYELEQKIKRNKYSNSDSNVIFEKLKEIISETLRIEEEQITLNSRFTYNADALDLAEFSMAVDEEFGIDIDDDKDVYFSGFPNNHIDFSSISSGIWDLPEADIAFKIETVKDALDYICQKLLL